MKKSKLLHTNIFIAIIIIVGFIATSIISYRSNMGLYKENVEHVSKLASDGLFYKIEAVISKPLQVSLTMSDDSFLKAYLNSGSEEVANSEYTKGLTEYLNVYKEKYEYDTVFLVSSINDRFYHFDGETHLVQKNAERDDWYFDLMKSDRDYYLNVETDGEDDGRVRLFINCKIKNDKGDTIGAVGIGVDVNEIQAILAQYEKEYAVSTYLTAPDGSIQVPYIEEKQGNANIQDYTNYSSYKNLLRTDTTELQGEWYEAKAGAGYISNRYLDNLNWNLIVSKDTGAMRQQFTEQLVQNILIIILILILVIYMISKLVNNYNTQIIKLTVSQEMEYSQLLQKTTAELYDSIFEINVSQNRASGQGVLEYYKQLGIPGDTPFDDALQIIAERQVKQEYAEGYLNMFRHESVLKAYANGITNLSYNLLFRTEDDSYEWMHIQAQLFYWNSDKSLHMISYRQNIDGEKRRELELIEKSQKDALTGLYNKRTSEEMIMETIKTNGKHAFVIIDIDNFKNVNDSFGHASGDSLLQEMSTEIKANFHASDIAGRLGGDEFVVMMKNYGDIAVIRNKLEQLCERARRKRETDKTAAAVSMSVGVSLFPTHGMTYSELYEKADQALYFSKGHGKDMFTIYGETFTGRTSYHVSQRDMDALINNASDGIIKVACAEKTKLLYFNQKRENLTGTPKEVLLSDAYVPLMQVHPEDRNKVERELQAAFELKNTFAVYYRLEKYSGGYVSVRLKGFFTNELYEEGYPIFYGVYEITEKV